MRVLFAVDKEALIAAYLTDPEAPLRASMQAQAEGRGDEADRMVADLAVGLLHHADMLTAERWVIHASQELDYTNARFLAVVWEMVNRDAAFLACDLYDHYLRNGGDDREAHEFAIGRFSGLGDKRRVLRTFEKAKRWFDPLTMARHPLFCVAVALVEVGDPAGAMAIYAELLRRDPTDQDARSNVRSIARTYGLPAAVAIYRETTQAILEALPAYANAAASKVGVIVDLTRQSIEDVFESLNQRGVCHIVGGCDPEVVGALLNRVRMPDHPSYPAAFVEDVVASIPRLFRFNARKLVSDSLGRPVEMDLSSSTVRKVDPADADSFTPFHQDVTAFQRLLVNIWVPLTPAGGDYPTVQFVAKRIQRIEQTMLARPGYNLIAIEETGILERYGDCLYEAAEVAPGDCVIFLGTTIHRSTNMDRATKSRYNLEVRWT